MSVYRGNICKTDNCKKQKQYRIGYPLVQHDIFFREFYQLRNCSVVISGQVCKQQDCRPEKHATNAVMKNTAFAGVFVRGLGFYGSERLFFSE
jgi:hypothetical protein